MSPAVRFSDIVPISSNVTPIPESSNGVLKKLFTNTFKHAFKDHPDPCILVKAVAVNEHLLEFCYSDNGAGIPAGEAAEKYTMGIPLIKDLTRQMNGQMTISGDKGLSYSFTIPV